MNTTHPLKAQLSLKRILAASIIAISLPLALTAYAEHGGQDGKACKRGDARPHHGMGFAKAGVPPYLHGIKLTNEQEDQIFTLMHAQMPELRKQHKQQHELMHEIRTTAQADKFDSAKIQQLADKAASLEKGKVLLFAQQDAKIFALLTPEQRKKAREFKGFRHDFADRDAQADDGENKRPAGFKRSSHAPAYRSI
ncbi:Spy/CpxP family protein refolding chaperone [Methylotenera sp. G11]|uniref:Spy/CpxP family protein refolding chaperone n=1 Tax=Methylotenera sp. G11 TaxID=1506585 RepID=UPI000646543C|nr:Spy/CpxP family protein refolding chaperone [Methylotenera sp. G11]